MLGQLGNRLLDELAQVALAVEVVRTRRRILELERTVFVLPVLLDRLEEHERVPRPVPKLVLREVRRDRVDPGRKLLRAVEPVQMPVHPNEDLLHQILGLFPIADRPVDEVQESRLVALDEFLESTPLAPEKGSHYRRIVQRT